MTNRITLHHLLIFFTMVCFSFFGSLSHIFTLTLIAISFANFIKFDDTRQVDSKAIILFSALTGCFLILLVSSIFRNNLQVLYLSLSPMFPIPLIALLIILQKEKDFQITPHMTAKFAQISILIAIISYQLISKFVEQGFLDLYNYSEGRVELFSGNPTPFAFSIFGISIFCLANWKESLNRQKLQAMIFFLFGLYFAGFLSGSRGIFLSTVLAFPLLVFYLSKTKIIALIITVSAFLLISLQLYSESFQFLPKYYVEYLENGIRTLLMLNKVDPSMAQRLEIWSAAIKAIHHIPFFGHSIIERYSAIVDYLPSNYPYTFTHPHNDVFAAVISGGYLAGIAAIFTIFSPFIAAMLASSGKTEKLFLGSILLISAIITAGFSTVFFNDICSAWLAFSTYLIWKIQY